MFAVSVSLERNLVKNVGKVGFKLLYDTGTAYLSKYFKADEWMLCDIEILFEICY